MRTDKMVLAAFTAASVEQTGIGAWTHPGSDRGRTEPEYYINLARVLERGGFDFVFFDDRLSMPGTYGKSYRASVRKGTRPIKLDVLTILGLMATHTTRLGLGATYSTTYYHPFHVARLFSTLDFLSKGRAIWNVVTSMSGEEAGNFGVDEHLEHDLRYDRADEFLEIVTGLWESWEPDAVVMDEQSGVFADPDKVHEINYEGKFLASRGPLTVPRSPQGWPVLLQAGQSGRGREFAARWADMVFMVGLSLEAAQRNYAAQREAVDAAGRGDRPPKIMPAVKVVVGESEAEAREKKAFLDTLHDPEEFLVLLSDLAGVDFSEFPLDETLPDDFLDRVTGSQGLIRNVVEATQKKVGRADITPRDIGAEPSGHHFVGDPKQVADEMGEWFLQEGCDGFAIMQYDSPGSFERFGHYVVPELRKRGLVPEPDQQAQTFRQRLGLPDRAA